MALQVSTLKTSFGNYKKDISDISNGLFSEWCDWVNKELYRFMLGVDPERFITSTTVTTTAGTSTYALPATFRSIDTFGTGLFLQASNGTPTDSPLARTSFASTKNGFYLSGSNIILTPTPQETRTYTLRYLPTVTKIDGITDYFTLDTTNTTAEIIGEEYLWHLVRLMDAFYTSWDEEVGAESLSDARIMNAMDELQRNIRRESNNVFLPDFSTAY